MGNRAALLLLLLVFCYEITMAMGFHREEKEDWRGEGGEEGMEEETRERRDQEWFLLQDSKRVFKTEAGDMRVVRNYGGRIADRPMHIGFITMQPKALFVPQYIDSGLILFIHRGEARVGLIYKDQLAERRLNMGDIYRIPAGSAFYLVNTHGGQTLHIICSIDPSESLGFDDLQSFFIGGGTNPTSVLAGFEMETLSNAFNVTPDDVSEIMKRQQRGPMIFPEDSRAPRPGLWTKFLQLEEQDRLSHLRRMVGFQQEVNQEEEPMTFSWRRLLNSLFGVPENKKKGETTGKSPDSYNIYKRKHDFENHYGWSIALDESDYEPLEHSGIGVYLVNLTAGSMMAPHVNPTATEYGIVLRGTGKIQIVFPNGTQAMNARVKEGDVFWVPKYFPFCQIAARSGPFEFFGFTTSARRNRPQFLIGASSILKSFRRPELAASFGVSEDKVKRLLDAQREAVILPSPTVAPPDERAPKVANGFGNDMILGFD